MKVRFSILLLTAIACLALGAKYGPGLVRDNGVTGDLQSPRVLVREVAAENPFPAQPPQEAQDDAAYGDYSLNLNPAEQSILDFVDNLGSRLYRLASPGVVNITTQDLYYNWFFEPVPMQGAGSGFLIDDEGYILTNYHVVAVKKTWDLNDLAQNNAKNIMVTLFNGVSLKAEFIGADPYMDVALLKIDPSDRKLEGRMLKPLPIEDNGVRVGQMTFAIGNPFGLHSTISRGIVSALNREITTERGFTIKSLVQTDTAINPGNSGGPLLNAHGKVVGINTLIISPDVGAQGIGFAIPASSALKVVPQLKLYGYVRRPDLGIEGIPLTSRDIVGHHLKNIRRGIVISKVYEDSPAAMIGLKPAQLVGYNRTGRLVARIGDILVAVDGQPVGDMNDLTRILAGLKIGDTVTIRYYRDGKLYEAEVELFADQRSLMARQYRQG